MKLHVQGCAGGIGGREGYTTCFRVDDDILLDAGTGITTMSIEQMSAIDHILLTHCHLDHVAGLALLVDVVRGRRDKPLAVYATEDVMRPLREHLFNWKLWPDFSEIPSPDNPVMRWETIRHGQTLKLGSRSLTCMPVSHTPGSSGYFVRNGSNGFVFTGDMSSTPSLWTALAAEPAVRKVIVDCSFPDSEASLADLSKHFCPSSLIRDIVGMPEDVEFLIYHLKPGQEELIMTQLHDGAGARTFRALKCGEVFEF